MHLTDDLCRPARLACGCSGQWINKQEKKTKCFNPSYIVVIHHFSPPVADNNIKTRLCNKSNTRRYRKQSSMKNVLPDLHTLHLHKKMIFKNLNQAHFKNSSGKALEGRVRLCSGIKKSKNTVTTRAYKHLHELSHQPFVTFVYRGL